MRRWLPLLVYVCAVLSSSLHAQTVLLGNLYIRVPTGWKVSQTAISDSIHILSFIKDEASITLFRRPHVTRSVSDYISSDAKTLQAVSVYNAQGISWSRTTTSKAAPVSSAKTVYVDHFLVNHEGAQYHGFSRAADESSARATTESFLSTANFLVTQSMSAFSLTAPNYTGQKYYLGWGAAQGGDPSFMHNEVKYDVLHTQSVFAGEWGGSYTDKQLIGSGTATSSKVRSAWKEIGDKMKKDDMYLQYSSGHGSSQGLGIGLSYKEIRDNALSYPAKEILIFIMACKSGALVDSFNRVRSKWENWKSEGRSLLVIASSADGVDSSTGPGTDPDEPAGVSGSAGSAFGHALWKALNGSSDGFSDGVKDGFVSLNEIRDYTRYRTKQIGGHTPQDTGTYLPHIVMNRIPSSSYLATLKGGTDSLTDAQIEVAIQEFDRGLANVPLN